MRQAEDFGTLCAVQANLSPLASSAEPKTGRNGKTYWMIVFSVEIHFGLTEFKARIKWNDSGVTKYGPASIIYNETPSAAASRTPSRTGFNGSPSKPPSTHSTPKQECFHDIPDVVRGDRDRSLAPSTHTRHSSASRPSVVTGKSNWRDNHAPSANGRSSNPASPATERAVSGSWRSEAGKIERSSKGKDRERDSYVSDADRDRGRKDKPRDRERSINGEHERSSVLGKIGEALTSPLASKAPSMYGRRDSVAAESMASTPGETRSRHSPAANASALFDTGPQDRSRGMDPEASRPLSSVSLMPGSMPEPVVQEVQQEVPQHLTPRALGLELKEAQPQPPLDA
ncbi:hypothetical protein PTI98_009102 [Pleurotus ostreatus]|nr:hypothetical protein PTI98_009102 [Pleurotus ostreatus]